MITLNFPQPLSESTTDSRLLSRFGLNQVFNSPGLYSLDSLEAPEESFCVIDPRIHFPDYTPSVDGLLGGIGSPSAQERKVFVFIDLGQVHPADDLTSLLVVNCETLQATRVVVTAQNQPARDPAEMLSPT